MKNTQAHVLAIVPGLGGTEFGEVRRVVELLQACRQAKLGGQIVQIETGGLRRMHLNFLRGDITDGGAERGEPGAGM